MKTRCDKSSDLSCLSSRYNDYFLTNASSIIGGYELGGIDPTGLGDAQKMLATALIRSIIRNSPPELALTQYYIHQNNPSVTIRPRSDKRSSIVSKRRELFLQNKRNLCSSKIFFLPELPFAHDLTTFKSFDFLQNLFTYPVSKEARSYINTRLSEKDSILVYEDDIKEAAKQLDEEIQTHITRLGLTSSGNRKLNAVSLWGLIKSLHTFDFSYLDMGAKPAIDNLNSRVFDANVTPVKIKSIDYLKISGVKPVYVRIASIKGFSDEYINDAAFSHGAKSPVTVKGNYVLMCRYRGLNKIQQNKYFKEVKDEVQRNQTNPLDLLSGNTKSALEQQLMMSDKDKAILNEVNQAMTLADYHGKFESSVAVFGDDLDEINNTCKELRTSLNQAGMDMVWESAGLDSAFECFLPGSQFESKRQMVLNSSKAAALSLYYKSSEGIPKWEYDTRYGNKEEESFYVLESNDGTPFHYTPRVGGKCLVIGVGPSGSGKTFMKNSFGTHFMKFGGILNNIDIDPGSEAVADFFGDDGSIFRLDEDFEAGFNPFFVSGGKNDKRFRAHLIRQIEMMISSNTNSDLKTFTRAEQTQVDNAIADILDLPKEMQSFATLLNHCNEDVNIKLSRFIGDGMYASFYDNDKDAIGSLKKRLCVYNIMGVKDDPVLLPLVMNEIVYRVLRTFEDPNIRDIFKMLDVDEAHNLLSIPGMPEFIVKGVRTWRKWNAGVSLWTQSPIELMKVEGWSAVRSAATTFWFMSDSEMDREIYREAFKLSDGHLDAIENLIPKRQAFIYQPSLRIAKVVNLYTEPEQRIINTSVAGESMLFKRNVERFDGDIDRAIQKTIKDLNFV